MGLFSRNESAADSGRRTASRSSVSSEAQTKELRNRARRRLIGALVLVVAAVIIVPMLLESESVPDQDAAPLVIPALTPPVIDSHDSATLTADAGVQPVLPIPDAGVVDGAPADAGTGRDADGANGQVSSDTQPKTEPPALPKTSAAEPRPKPEKPTPEEKPTESKRAEKPAPVKRTDDGSVAMALLAGRKPGQAAAEKAPTQGNYVLQIAAYSTNDDAQIRRDKLVAAGVTNAYVEKGLSSGSTTYRLRVGPFPTREAAQAAQARLRALGYDNGFISTK